MSVETVAAAVGIKDWKIDPGHSTFEFAVRHILVSTIKGVFTDVTGTIHYDPDAVENSKVEALVQIASIDTHDRKRDEKMLSGEYFDVATYPTASFKSTRVEPVEPGRFRVVGDLTLRGVTNEVVFDTEFVGTAEQPNGIIRSAFIARATIQRTAFGFARGREIPAGGPTVRDDVELTMYTTCHPRD